MPTVSVSFELLPLGNTTIEGHLYSLDMTADGVATIEYSDAENWFVAGVSISATAKIGERYVTRLVAIERRDPRWPLIVNALVESERDRIEGCIVDDMRELGNWRDPNSEHRLGARELGLACLQAANFLFIGAVIAHYFLGDLI